MKTKKLKNAERFYYVSMQERKIGHILGQVFLELMVEIEINSIERTENKVSMRLDR